MEKLENLFYKGYWKSIEYRDFEQLCVIKYFDDYIQTISTKDIVDDRDKVNLKLSLIIEERIKKLYYDELIQKLKNII